MTPKKKTPQPETSILTRAMLANVSISMWEGRKHDREVTAKVNQEHHASSDAGRYHKHLFGGKVPELSAILTAASTLRTVHYAQTLPWSDTGWRLLPTENYMAYADAMRGAIAKFNSAVDAFLTAYPELVRKAQAKLQDMYRHHEYPTINTLRRKFHVALECSPIPAGEDFRIALPDEELQRVRTEVEGRVQAATKTAMEDAWARLGDAITNLRSRLNDGKFLRDSMIEKLIDVAEILGRLNLTQDPKLELARTQVLQELSAFDAETLRKDDRTRAQVARSADAILKSMQGVYTPAPAEPKEAA